jgi:hypothetical protein
MSLSFKEYIALWQEQIDEEELAELRLRTKAIVRTANRRRLRDIALLLLAVGMVCMFLWLHPTPLLTRLGFVPLVALLVGVVWRRHQITMAARAITVDHPRFFFDSAIRNARSELNLSRFDLWLGWPMFVVTVILVKTAQGIDIVRWIRRLPHDINAFGITTLTLVVLVYLYFLREHGKMRAQLRRLEAMRREWEDQAGR